MKNIFDGNARLFFWVVLLIVITTLLLCSCGTKQKQSQPSSALDQAQAKGEFYISKITDDIYKERCDKLTFKSLYAAAAYSLKGIEVDLSALEDNGKWNRDVAPCYPDNSKSEISFDGMVGVLHYILAHKDDNMLGRLITYGNEHSWIMGEGPKEYTNIYVLTPMIFNLRSHMSLVDNPVTDILKGFKGHLLVDYLWLEAEKDGTLGAADMETLRQLKAASPDDPMYSALYHRFTDGDQTEALDILLNNAAFPNSSLPMETGVFNWGSAPASVYYLVTLAIIEGK